MANREVDLESLLDYLKRTRGFDFTGYKRASLARRIEKRMHDVSAATPSDYVDYLEVHPEEFSLLFNTVLINVTTFLRDPQAWEFVASTLIPELIARNNGPIRVWSAGCASGEEAYTLAMLFAEAMEPEAFRARVKIYATDVDEEALNKARLATYTAREVVDIPPELLEKYFEGGDEKFVFRKDLRRYVIFGRHDLIQDAPISRVDLLVCRNTLMYFNAETQARILGRFHFAINDSGYLMLGRAETLMTHTNSFAAVDLKRRISMKVSRRPRDLVERPAAHSADGSGHASVAAIRLRDVALDGGFVAQLVVDANGILVAANERARSLFLLPRTDIGRPLQDLKISYRPLELRSSIEQVTIDRRTMVIRDVDWRGPGGEQRWLEAHITPLVEAGTFLGVSVTFVDVTTTKRLQQDLEHSHQELESSYEELQSTNEELETTNEELQSTVEELETTNEELQSTNEELETMNEELQSTNEELHTMNDELRERGDEVGRLNAFLESILTSIRGGVIVVDPELRILVWSHGAEDLWGLREKEVTGRNLLGLDIGLPTERLKQPIKNCLGDGGEPVELVLDAVNRRGKSIRCRVVCAPLVNGTKEIRGAILIMNDDAARGAASSN